MNIQKRKSLLDYKVLLFKNEKNLIQKKLIQFLNQKPSRDWVFDLLVKKWAQKDSNLRPKDYESPTLTS